MYIEKLPKTWSAICIGIYLAGVAYMGFDSVPQDTGPWLAVSALFLLILLPCLSVPISKAIYNRIQIDPAQGTLRVGRERIPLANVDPASVHHELQQQSLSHAQRYAASMGNIDAPVPGLRATDRGAPRLVGGGWGVPMGMDSVVIRTRQGEPLSIATHNRMAFLTALANATTSGTR
ncbi:hypothetical protein OG369_20975 [Streptomyces sp. NBC_01221]|uniref:hypothetical protein n=1 Tax=Streptomyces sp. NBC_01221 TaxID=2903782 RepID=UPI00224FF073|nr:hypothetical protein [Streptomyces sp. NBC_01221]MCX4788552.1 hypothetical protein [Streptomyces sp. NBC_01221]